MSDFYYKKSKTQDGRDILFIRTPRFYIKSSFSNLLGCFKSFIELRYEKIIVGMGDGDTAHNAIRAAIMESRDLKVLLNKYLKQSK